MKNENLGKTAVDRITGFTGIIIGYAQYLTGCDQYAVQPESKNPAKKRTSHWFDAGRLEFHNREVEPENVQGEEPGCDVSPPNLNR